VLGSGSALIGKSLKTEIRREEALELALEGFLPFTQRGEPPKEEKRSLFRELGLPYVSDPAITRHLNAFWSPPARFPTPFSSTAVSSFRRFCKRAPPTWWATGTAAARDSGRTASWIWPWRAVRPTTRTCARRQRRAGARRLARELTYIALGEPRDGKFPAVCLGAARHRRRGVHRD